MKGDMKEFRDKGKPHRSTFEYCGKLILTAEHPMDAMLLALLGRAIFQLGDRPEIKHGRQELSKWLLERLTIATPEAQQMREHLASLAEPVEDL
jgi:hypothetical protein